MLRESLPQILTELPGPKSKEVIERRLKAIPSAISCATPCVIDRAEGAMVQDLDGNIFVDWVGGIGVLNIGHCHPEVVEAVKRQTERYFHPQINTIHYTEYIELAEKINDITPGDHKKRTAFFNSGAEAVENSIKIARKHTKRTEVIAFTGGFHGRTFMAMTLTSTVKPYKNGFAPLVPGVHRAPYPDTYRVNDSIPKEEVPDYCIKQLEKIFVDDVSPETVAAIIIEPVLGDGGFVIAPDEYIKKLRAICDKYNILLIADEIQTGYCRTGKLFATDYWADFGVYPDILITAKSMAGGLPISAVTGRDEIMEACASGELGGTYGGNPIACASALKVIEVLQRDDYAEKAVKIGEVCMKRFESWYDKYEFIGEFRGKGAMLALEIVEDRVSKKPDAERVNRIMTACKQNGLILKNAGPHGQVIRALMPLNITMEQLEAGLQILEKALDKEL
ncbi:MAG: 4-aminobutyrate--2-oxoglutarate transaminase [Bacillota bacterium]|nr:4-aminobutyrate--2-oxoglutarate transaminase [Bacillota bacterium]